MLFLLVFGNFAFQLFAQPNNAPLQNLLKKHISFLAADSLEGRETGTKGERLAYQYIVQEFEKIGIEAKGDADSFIQTFEFKSGQQITTNNGLSINGHPLQIEKDFRPLSNSPNGAFEGLLVDVGYGIQATQLKYNDYKKTKKLTGKVFLINASTPEGDNPHSAFYPFSSIDYKIEKAIAFGAKAIIFHGHSSDLEKKLQNHQHNNVTKAGCPVIYLIEKSNIKKSSIVKGQVDFEAVFRQGHNVLGYIDNQAPYTVVIGAHYDHLGYGTFGSLYNGERAVHNGADDNASGVALVIELARQLKRTKTNNNYLFACFSGEEMGLYGSNFYTKVPTVPLESINYMLNFDMIGRMDTASTLVVNGVGTSPNWDVLKKIKVADVHFKTTESGIGASDHTSFYIKDIPAVHFFTGAHKDYHKPSDDEDKINYVGLEYINDVVLSLIDSLDTTEKIIFNKTDDQTNNNAPRFTVTLGVIPDYLYSNGDGMRIESVRENRVAAKAGLKDGDIVVKMGDVLVTDIQTYMLALSKFEKGQSTTLSVKRDRKILTKKITFF